MLERAIPLDLSVQISTPENIRFEYRISGPFRRLPAFLLDFIFRSTFITLVVILFSCSGLPAFIPFSTAAFAFFLLISVFLLEWFYGLLFETFWNGQTPGKRILGLRVISVDGHPINAVQATIRNFLRFADFFPFVPLACIFEDMPGWIPIFTVGTASMVLTDRMQRLGDIAAGTMVVIDEKTWFTRHAKLDDPRAAQLSEHIPPSFVMSRSLAQTVALYVERRALISMGRRLELANKLARPLLRQFGFRDDTSPDLLLCALYYRDFIAKQSNAFSLQDSPSPRQSDSPLRALSNTGLAEVYPQQSRAGQVPVGIPVASHAGSRASQQAVAPESDAAWAPVDDVEIIAEVAKPSDQSQKTVLPNSTEGKL